MSSNVDNKSVSAEPAPAPAATNATAATASEAGPANELSDSQLDQVAGGSAAGMKIAKKIMSWF